MPHWSCHFYRLETSSGFRVGSWSFTERDSLLAIAVYTLLIVANLSATTAVRPRVTVATISGMLHLLFAAIHFYRLSRPFPFQVFGYDWPMGASLREAIILSAFGMGSLAVAIRLRRAHT